VPTQSCETSWHQAVACSPSCSDGLPSLLPSRRCSTSPVVRGPEVSLGFEPVLTPVHLVHRVALCIAGPRNQERRVVSGRSSPLTPFRLPRLHSGSHCVDLPPEAIRPKPARSELRRRASCHGRGQPIGATIHRAIPAPARPIRGFGGAGHWRAPPGASSSPSIGLVPLRGAATAGTLRRRAESPAACNER
jgi:hypothetical protein